jgi:hypothetical protein
VAGEPRWSRRSLPRTACDGGRPSLRRPAARRGGEALRVLAFELTCADWAFRRGRRGGSGRGGGADADRNRRGRGQPPRIRPGLRTHTPTRANRRRPRGAQDRQTRCPTAPPSAQPPRAVNKVESCWACPGLGLVAELTLVRRSATFHVERRDAGVVMGEDVGEQARLRATPSCSTASGPRCVDRARRGGDPRRRGRALHGGLAARLRDAVRRLVVPRPADRRPGATLADNGVVSSRCWCASCRRATRAAARRLARGYVHTPG